MPRDADESTHGPPGGHEGTDGSTRSRPRSHGPDWYREQDLDPAYAPPFVPVRDPITTAAEPLADLLEDQE